MGRHNEIYRLYQEMLDGYNSNTEVIFAHGARCLMALNPESPFTMDTTENEYFGQMQLNYERWANKGIDTNVSYRRLISAAKELCALVKENPFTYDEVEAKEEEEQKKKELEALKRKDTSKEIKKSDEVSDEEHKEDVNYLITRMANACLLNQEASYEMYVIHLMDTAIENPFKFGSDEYELFSIMKACYTHNPPNKRKTFVVGKQLCDLINFTEVEPKKIEKPKQTVLGVIPEEKKSWRKILFPWKKDGGQDDSSRTN